MEEQVWLEYFARLHNLLGTRRARVEELIGDCVRHEVSTRFTHIGNEGIQTYIETAVSFIDERLFEYDSSEQLERVLRLAASDVSAAEYADVDAQLEWYDSRKEKDSIDARIETGLNLKQTTGDILDALLKEFGAFPNKSIIESYNKKPEGNHLPDYALANAFNQVVRESVRS